MSLLDVQNISFSYSEDGHKAINNVSFTVEKGDYTAIIGTNGSGKSTLSRVLSGFLTPQNGSIISTEGMITGIVFQSPKEQIVCNVIKRDTAFGPQNLNLDDAEIELRTIECLSITGLLDRINSGSTSLSLGQTQKLAFSGIIALHPDLLILDEVTAMLDPASRSEIVQFLNEWNKKGHTIIHITHHKDEAFQAKKIIAINAGSVIFNGTTFDFLQNSLLNESIFGPSIPEEPVVNKLKQTEQKTVFAFSNINFSYENKPILSNLSFSLKKGTLTALTGASGSGKSTMLEIAAGLLIPEQGNIFAAARPVLARQDCEAALFENFAADDVAFGPLNNGISKDVLLETVKKSMNMVSLPFENFANRQTFLLSGGEQRRLSIAGIIAMNSPIMLFDEPTANLDAAGCRQIMKILKTLCNEGKTVLFSTHKREEADFADREIHVENGKIVSDTVPVIDIEKTPENRLFPFEPLEGSSILESLRKTEKMFVDSIHKDTGMVKYFSPLLKYLLFFVLFIPSLVLNNIWMCLSMWVITVLYAILVKYPIKRLIISFLKVTPWLLFFGLFQMIFFPAQKGELAYLPWRWFLVTPSKLLLCAKTFVRTYAAFSCISGFVYSTSEQEIIEGFSTLLTPLKVVKIPINNAIVILEILFRFIPLLIEEASSIIKTQLVRGGLRKAKGFTGKIRVLVPLFVPLMIQTVKRSEILADALTARYFNIEVKNDY